MTQLERFIEHGEIEIHQHPLVGLKRLLVLEEGFLWFPVQKQIHLKFKVYYLDSEGNRLESQSLQPYIRPLVAHTASRLNSNMQTVLESSEDWESSKTEYDYFKDVLKTKDVDFYQLILNTVLFRASVNGGNKFDN